MALAAADIHILVQQGEGTTLEFKESLSSSFARELVALANTQGGRILLGVSDDGVVKGIKDSNALRARIQDIARNCNPPVRVLANRVGEVFVVEVGEASEKPVQCSDGFFWRQGAETQKLSRDEIRDFFRAEGEILFDLSPCPRFNYPEDFDRDKFDAWLRLSGITAGSVEDVLVNIDVAERAGDRLLFRNAGVLFFAKNVRRFFTDAYITCLLGRGTDKVHILDRKDFDGGVVADIEDAMRFIERNTRLAYRIEGLRRQNIPEYPMEALREAITNAVMHRDWFFRGANVFVELYADRIEVISPGTLPKGMTLDDLGHKSVRRNPHVADLLHRIDFIEKAGTGIRRIRDGAKAVDCPEPAFEAGSFVTVTFRPNPEVRQSAGRELGPIPKSADQVTDQVVAQAADQETAQVTDQVTDQVGRQLIVLQSIFGESSRQEIQQALGLKHTRHFRDAYLLPTLHAGLIEMTIPDKPRSSRQRYRLTSAGRRYLRRAGTRTTKGSQ